MLKKADLPIAVIGLGVQANLNENLDDIDPNSLKFVQLLKDSQANISVRGKHTGTVLEKLGVKDYTITGCPSNFINPKKNLGVLLEEKFRSLTSLNNLIVNCDVKKIKADLVPHLVRFTEENNGTWVTQVFPEISFLRNQATDAEIKNLLHSDKIMKPGNPNFIFSFIKKHGCYFLDVDAWMEFLIKFDLSMGTMLHGNMMAWQAGVPAVWIPHDARTLELINTMKLPYIDKEKFTDEKNVIETLKYANFDGEAFDKRRKELILIYLEFLKRSGIQINDECSWMLSS